jgi:hypothetical protein
VIKREGGRHFKVLIICVLIWINCFFQIGCPFICISNYFYWQPAMFRCADCMFESSYSYFYVNKSYFLWRVFQCLLRYLEKHQVFYQVPVFCAADSKTLSELAQFVKFCILL